MVVIEKWLSVTIAGKMMLRTGRESLCSRSTGATPPGTSTCGTERTRSTEITFRILPVRMQCCSGHSNEIHRIHCLAARRIALDGRARRKSPRLKWQGMALYSAERSGDFSCVDACPNSRSSSHPITIRNLLILRIISVNVVRLGCT